MTTKDSNLISVVPDDFNTWLIKFCKKKVVIIPAIGSIISFGAALFPLGKDIVPQISNFLASEWLLVVFFGFHAISCLVLLFLIPEPESNIEISERASIAVEQFLQTWRKLWLFWFILYAGLSTEAMAIQLGIFKNAWFWRPSLNFFNNLQTIALVICYIIVTKKTVDTSQPSRSLPWERWLGVLILVTVVELLALMLSNYIYIEFFPEFFRWFSGISASVALALVVGRLDSKFINPPTWTVVLMYLYVAIQPGWERFAGNPPVQAVLVGLALILKCIMFLFIAWLFQSGVLLFYMEKTANLTEHAEKQRSAYLQNYWYHRQKTSQAQELEDE